MEFSAFHDHAQGCSCPGCWLHGVGSFHSTFGSVCKVAPALAAGCTVWVRFIPRLNLFARLLLPWLLAARCVLIRSRLNLFARLLLPWLLAARCEFCFNADFSQAICVLC
jgi:hypothetical protein